MGNRFLGTNLVFAALASVVPAAGCQAQGPELPPAASVTMDVSLYKKSTTDPVEDKSNFAAAATRVLLLDAGIVVALAPPALVFSVAVSQQPVFEDGKWIWDFTAKSDGDTIAAHLTGWFDGNLRTGTFLDLEMRVTCTGCKTPTQDYVWYTGRFNTAGTDGYWQFYNPEIAQADQTFVRIDYDVTDDTHKSLTFTNERTDGHEDAGDVILYQRDGDLAHVSVHDQSEGLDYVAEWSMSAGSGWIQVPDYNGGQKACWDSRQVNTPCP